MHSVNVHVNTGAKGNPIKAMKEDLIIFRFERPTSRKKAKSNRKTGCFQRLQSQDKLGRSRVC